MLRNILFPTDFSEASVRVKNKLIKMASCGIKEVHLIHILDERKLAYAEYIDSFSFGSLMIDKNLKMEMENKLEKWKLEFEAVGIKVKTRIISGTPFDSTLEYAKANKVTSIYLGHNGHNRKDKTILGSTAEKVSRKSDITIVLI